MAIVTTKLPAQLIAGQGYQDAQKKKNLPAELMASPGYQQTQSKAGIPDQLKAGAGYQQYQANMQTQKQLPYVQQNQLLPVNNQPTRKIGAPDQLLASIKDQTQGNTAGVTVPVDSAAKRAGNMLGNVSVDLVGNSAERNEAQKYLYDITKPKDNDLLTSEHELAKGLIADPGQGMNYDTYKQNQMDKYNRERAQAIEQMKAEHPGMQNIGANYDMMLNELIKSNVGRADTESKLDIGISEARRKAIADALVAGQKQVGAEQGFVESQVGNLVSAMNPEEAAAARTQAAKTAEAGLKSGEAKTGAEIVAGAATTGAQLTGEEKIAGMNIASAEKISGANIASRERMAADENAIRKAGLSIDEAALKGYTDANGVHVKGEMEIAGEKLGLAGATLDLQKKELEARISSMNRNDQLAALALVGGKDPVTGKYVPGKYEFEENMIKLDQAFKSKNMALSAVLDKIDKLPAEQQASALQQMAVTAGLTYTPKNADGTPQIDPATGQPLVVPGFPAVTDNADYIVDRAKSDIDIGKPISEGDAKVLASKMNEFDIVTSGDGKSFTNRPADVDTLIKVNGKPYKYKGIIGADKKEHIILENPVNGKQYRIFSDRPGELRDAKTNLIVEDTSPPPAPPTYVPPAPPSSYTEPGYTRIPSYNSKR